MQHRNVYNGRFLFEEKLESKSSDVAKQNDLAGTHVCDSSVFLEQDEPPSTKMTSHLPHQQHKVCCDSIFVVSAVSSSNDFWEQRMTIQPIVSPRTLQNVTYLGKPLSLQNHAKFQLMVMSPVGDIEDDDSP